MKLPKEMKGRQKSIISFNRVMNGLEVYNAEYSLTRPFHYTRFYQTPVGPITAWCPLLNHGVKGTRTRFLSNLEIDHEYSWTFTVLWTFMNIHGVVNIHEQSPSTVVNIHEYSQSYEHSYWLLLLCPSPGLGSVSSLRGVWCVVFCSSSVV